MLKKVLDLGFRHLEPANHSAAQEPGTGLGIPAGELAELLEGRTEMVSWDTFGANHQKGDRMTPEDFVSAGEGMMPLGEILKTADALGVEAAVWEQDDCGTDFYQSLARTVDYLRSFKHLAI